MTIPASTHVGRLHVATRHLPAAKGGGGDIHDVMATPFGIRLLIGDVMGTGLPANRTGLSVLNAWRELACTEPSLAEIAVRLHAVIASSQHPERFVTALLATFAGVLGPDEVAGSGESSPPGVGEPGGAGPSGGGWAELVCCGHPPPLLLRGGSAVFVEPCPAPPLGLLDLADGSCRASMIPVGEGDRLLLYTDGVSEARDRAGRFFPLVEHAAQALDASRTGGPHLLDTLVASLDDHVGERVADDILLLLVTVD
jgi:serine phosphatase RsbU (regulator of sigma subunit)